MTVVQLTWKWRGCWAGVRCISLLHMSVFCICQLASTWRSGSTFLAEILTSSQPSFYHYEPLLQFNVTQVRGSDTPARKHSAYRIVNKLFDCDFYDLGMIYHISTPPLVRSVKTVLRLPPFSRHIYQNGSPEARTVCPQHSVVAVLFKGQGSCLLQARLLEQVLPSISCTSYEDCEAEGWPDKEPARKNQVLFHTTSVYLVFVRVSEIHKMLNLNSWFYFFRAR